ncbi:hypothetical protein A3D07_00200 [Candidatus Curtissbacteria bacterium RIFCSPHIGHO2_02_FULL_42_15]|uniref:Uncharacterized protein n=1 Tax=Candidatus Curtissbacteria bacterium RIFCSPHIGHO2_02_FULL_42_15 TaxID=1797716 RepID=A0A1F5GFN0_9BACT|nr:MAG: hypothetical protein A3D07_00200 [Candidatus Curtissbacteria bacterium RIFCSPHIGHO2_02_FULL_42_15]
MAHKNRQKLVTGQSLVEVVVSIGIAVILAISLITTSLITQKSSRSARNNSQATKLVQQTLEQLRVFRDRNGFKVSTFPDALTPPSVCFTFTTPDLNNPSTWSLTSGCSTPQTVTLGTTIFTRKVEMINEPLVANAAKRLITVTVSWDEAGQTRSVKSQTFLGLWQDFP